MAATSGEMTCSVSTLSWPGSPLLVSITSPPAPGGSSLTFWIPIGAPSEVAIVPLTRWPSWARVWKACAMLSGVTPCSRPPRIIAGLVEIGVSMPISWAVLAMFSVPTCRPSSAYTELSE